MTARVEAGDGAATTARVVAGCLAAVVAVWGGALGFAAIEGALPADVRWLGHAGFHVWTAIVAAVVAVVALRSARSLTGPQRRLAHVVATIGAFAAVTSLFDAVGAYPTLRAFHDAVNTVARPALWVLTAILLAVAAAVVAASVRRAVRPGTGAPG